MFRGRCRSNGLPCAVTLAIVVGAMTGFLVASFCVFGWGHAAYAEAGDANNRSPGGAHRFPLPKPIEMHALFDTAKECPHFSGILTVQNGLVALLVPGTLGWQSRSMMPGLSPQSMDFNLGTADCGLHIEIRHWSKRGDRLMQDPINWER